LIALPPRDRPCSTGGVEEFWAGITCEDAWITIRACVNLLRFPEEARIEAIISALERLPQVRSVSKNWILRPDFTPDDYYFNHDYNCDGRLARCQPGGDTASKKRENLPSERDNRRK
jgi:hypothetical protein